MNKFHMRKGGFTLIELMIVVAIIGILAAIAIPNFIRFQLKSKSSEGKVNLAAIRTAEESYMAEFGTYVGTTLSPAAIPGTSKVAWVDTGTVGNNFDTLGWGPEGNVYFQYGVATNGTATTPATTYTASASANIDGNASEDQAWGYVKNTGDLTTPIAVAGLHAVCAITGTWDASQGKLSKSLFDTVGPCDGTSGQSWF